jgi:DNA repair photolyase
LIASIPCRTALSKSTLPGLDYSLNPYWGCGHGCRYCYVPDVLRSEELHREWGKLVLVKEGIEEILRREVGSKGKGTVGVSTVTDPYQPLESKTELTRRCLEILRSAGFRVSIQTKSGLVLRDRDLLGPGFDVGVTIITMDEGLSRLLEPGACPPSARAQVLEELSGRVETWLFLGPVIPGVNDDEESLGEIIRLARRTQSLLLFDWFRPKPWATQRLLSALQGRFEAKTELFQNREWRDQTLKKVQEICRQLGVRLQHAWQLTLL